MPTYPPRGPSSATFASNRRTTSSATAPTTSSTTAHPTTSSSQAAGSSSSSSITTMAPSKSRHYAHLNSQLAQLNAHLADTENLMRLTAAQAGDMKFLGGYVGGLFMGSAKVLGEEGVRGDNGDGDGSAEKVKEEEQEEGR